MPPPLSVGLLPSEIEVIIQALRRNSPQTEEGIQLSTRLQLLLERTASCPTETDASGPAEATEANEDILSALSDLSETDDPPSALVEKETVQDMGVPKGGSSRRVKASSALKRKKPGDKEEGNGNGERARFVNAWPPCVRNGKRARMAEYEESEEVYQPADPCFHQAEDLVLKLTSGC
ncbi:hypothetical protein K435DRAFT_862068 [Dendrothele bispora CBS 962.96]|uniref:Uncharacterized protein n=1 Tax=Dendrothele bispora (strain CBS 962.96) TaxID=1314807 RepID=A0A4S8LTM4_DENBC|nr:hypothetical protein K435DRAFT_862068 [Dendrothele bispora CBS 962.96]